MMLGKRNTDYTSLLDYSPRAAESGREWQRVAESGREWQRVGCGDALALRVCGARLATLLDASDIVRPPAGDVVAVVAHPDLGKA